MNDVRELFGILDIEVVDVGSGTDAGERSNGVSGVHTGHETERTGSDLFQTFRSGGLVVGIFNGICVGADEEVAVNGGGYENTLASFGGAYKQGGVCHIAADFVHDDVFAASGDDGDGEVVLTENFGYFGRVNARAVDDIACCDGFVAVGDIVDITGHGCTGYFEIEVEINEFLMDVAKTGEDTTLWILFASMFINIVSNGKNTKEMKTTESSIFVISTFVNLCPFFTILSPYIFDK